MVAEEGASSRRRWLFGSMERQRDLSPSLSLSLPLPECSGTGRTKRYRMKGVRWRETLLPRSPVPDEQIREYGRWKYRFRLEATADVLLISPSSFALYLWISLFLLHSFVLRSNASPFTLREDRTRAHAPFRLSACEHVHMCVYACR